MGLIAYRIEIDGQDVTDLWRRERRLESITITDREGQSSDSINISLDDRPPHIAWPPAGARLRAWLGNTQDDLTDMGSFTLDSPQASCPPHRLDVSGHAAEFIAGEGLSMHAERFRVWEAVSLADMVETIAQDHGLIARVQAGIGSEIVTAEQIDESDLSLLTRLARLYGGRLRIKGSAANPKGALELVGAGSQLPRVVLTPRDVSRWSAPLGSRAQVGTVIAYWHNAKTGQSGVRQAGSGEPRIVLTEPLDSAQSAASAAKSRLKDGERNSAQISITLGTLNTSLASGAQLALAGFRSEIDTIWNVTEARHYASARRASTTLTAERSVV